MVSLQCRSVHRRGLTLIELVVVLVILAAVAMLVVPRLGYLKEQSDSATGAAGAAQIAANLEVYKASTGYYPQRLDSLLLGDGTTAPTGVYDKMFVLNPGPTTGAPGWLTMEDLGPSSGSTYYRSISYAGLFGSAYFVMDHSNAASVDPNDSGVGARNRKSAGGNYVAILNTADPYGIGASIAQAAGYSGGTVPAGVKLLVMGVGPGNALVGKSMVSAPLHSASLSTNYGRYLAIFALYETGRAAELKTVVDPRGGSISGNLSDYKAASISN